MSRTFVLGYGQGEIEPGIAPLVQAVTNAGYRTFSSCEGHPTQESELHQFPAVSFYSNEQDALKVQLAFIRIRETLHCSWVLRAGFVAHRDTNAWALGWTLENCGAKGGAPTREEFEKATLEAGRAHDLPLLIEMFGSLQ